MKPPWQYGKGKKICSNGPIGKVWETDFKKSLTFFFIPFIVLRVISYSSVIVIHVQYYEINIV